MKKLPWWIYLIVVIISFVFIIPYYLLTIFPESPLSSHIITSFTGLVGVTIGASIAIFGSLYVQRESQKSSLYVKRIEEVINPIYHEIESNLDILEFPEELDLSYSVYAEKNRHPLFLASDKKFILELGSLYRKIETHNQLLKMLIDSVKYRISEEIYKFFEGRLVPLRGEHHEQIDTKFKSFCYLIAHRNCIDVTKVLLRNRPVSIGYQEYYILGKEIEDIFKKNRFLIDRGISDSKKKYIDEEDISAEDQYISDKIERFSKPLYEKLFKISVLKEAQKIRKQLIKESEKIGDSLLSKISKIKLE